MADIALQLNACGGSKNSPHVTNLYGYTKEPTVARNDNPCPHRDYFATW
ncbi:hypothetical protein [Dyadobacter bucti]|nr:hypothetical protein [Dyadobacter bucti]